MRQFAENKCWEYPPIPKLDKIAFGDDEDEDIDQSVIIEAMTGSRSNSK